MNLAGSVVVENQSLQSTLRRGWYFGSAAFREKLLERVGKPQGNSNQSEHQDQVRQSATQLLDAGLQAVGLQRQDLPALKKNDPRKAFIAYQIVTKTPTSRAWIAAQLHMGQPTTVTRTVKIYRDDPTLYRTLHAEHEQKISKFAT